MLQIEMKTCKQFRDLRPGTPPAIPKDMTTHPALGSQTKNGLIRYLVSLDETGATWADKRTELDADELDADDAEGLWRDPATGRTYYTYC